MIEIRNLIFILLILLLIIFFNCYNVIAVNNWNSLNKNLGKMYIATITIDIIQTRHWHKGTKNNKITMPNGEIVYELNPLIAGRNYPEIIIITSLANYGFYKFIDLLEPKQRTAILLGAIVIESYIILKNSSNIERYGVDKFTLFNINF